jgi:DNA polymerase-3 subunit epsilon
MLSSVLLNADMDLATQTRRLQLQRPIAVLDLETTGIFIEIDRIVEVGIVKLTSAGERESFYQRVNPEIKIPPEASAVHGIRNEDVASQPTFKQTAKGLEEFLSNCDLAGFNILSFDLPILQKEFERAGVSFSIEGRHVIDAKEIYHLKEPRDLASAVSLYCGRRHQNAHSAFEDAAACLDVLEGQLARYPDLPDRVEDLSAFSQQFRQQRYLDSGRWFQSRYGKPAFARGAYAGRGLDEVAAVDPDFLKSILCREDLSGDTREMILKAVK